MTLSISRNELTNIYNYIKYQVLGLEYVESYEDIPAVLDNGLYKPSPSVIYEPFPSTVGRGFCVFDEVSGVIDVSQEQSNRVSVTGSSSYTVNYLLSGVESASTVTSISFFYYYVSVLLGWPEEVPPQLPLVAVSYDANSRKGFQLGSGHLSEREFSLTISATSDAERDDILESLMNGLYNKSIPFIDYSTGDYLTHGGVYNSSFISPSHGNPSKIYFDKVSSRILNSTSDWGVLNKYRAVVDFTSVLYKE